jgi:diguanylate cyclase (GGDEF)-like protein
MPTNEFNTIFWKAALESAGQGVWDYDIRTGRRDHSDVWHHIRGQEPGVYVTPSDQEWIESIHPDDRKVAQDQTNRLNAGELAEVAYEYRERHAEGHWMWIMCRGRAVEWDAHGKPFRFVGTDTDITRIKASEDAVKAVSRRLELALSSVQMGVWRYDVTQDAIEWDARLKSIYGLPEDAPVPRNAWERALHPDDYRSATEAARTGLAQKLDYDLSYRIIRPDGDVRFIHSRVSFQNDLIGGPILVGINWDATGEHERSVALETANRLAAARNAELEAARAEMEHNALHDTLTGLPNRRKLDQVQREHGARPQGRFAILHIDLDRFKQINDVYGHDVGDFVLRNTADILRDCVPDGALVARVGGDEFAILVPDAPDEPALSLLAAHLIQRAAQPVSYLGNECRYGISIGIAVAEGDAADGKSLFVNADLALYRAKNEGRGRFCFFREAMRTQAMAVKQRADEILAGIERDEFFCVYQPQFCAQTLRITGVEALVRWQSPRLGVMQPSDFLTLAEEMNLLARIDQIVLRKCSADFRLWAREGLAVPRLSVNLSKSRLRDPNLARELAGLNLMEGRLSLELLESNFLDVEDEVVSANIRSARQSGIEIEVDDFGTGHASIVSLLRLKPDRLKIDRALVEHMEGSQTQAQLLTSIIEIGHLLGISITAEGVENDRQIQMLQALGCDELQGYALARPMTSADLITFLRDRTRLAISAE